MGEMIRVAASDGHELDAYRAAPAGASSGGIVVVQEIFGLTAHIKRVTDRYAAAGFDAIAPAMFDRIEPGIVLDYTDVETGRSTMSRLEWPATLLDVEAAAAATRSGMSIGVVGFCWGGTVAHVAASDLPIAAAVSYYGAGVPRMLDKHPKCPIMYHFGEQDGSIPPDAVAAVREAFPNAVYHIYAGAKHGFNCEDRASFSPEDAKVAFERSLSFLKEHVV